MGRNPDNESNTPGGQHRPAVGDRDQHSTSTTKGGSPSAASAHRPNGDAPKMSRRFPYLTQEELNDRSLKPNRKAVLNLMRGVARNSGEAYIRETKIAKLIGVHRNTVLNSIRDLKRRGLLNEPERPVRRGPNVYRMTAVPMHKPADFDAHADAHADAQVVHRTPTHKKGHQMLESRPRNSGLLDAQIVHPTNTAKRIPEGVISSPPGVALQPSDPRCLSRPDTRTQNTQKNPPRAKSDNVAASAPWTPAPLTDEVRTYLARDYDSLARHERYLLDKWLYSQPWPEPINYRCSLASWQGVHCFRCGDRFAAAGTNRGDGQYTFVCGKCFAEKRRLIREVYRALGA